MNPTAESTVRCAVDARVVQRTAVCREHTILEFDLPDFPPTEPGQFVQLRCCDTRASESAVREWSTDGFPSLSEGEFCQPQPLLRRPFSIADRWTTPDGATRLGILFRTVGMGTRWLEHLRPGDTLNLTGPLGHGFRVPAPDVPLVLIGGGVGIPPLLYLARRLHESGGRDVTAIFGVTTRDLLPLPLLAEPAPDGTARVCVQLPGGARFPTLVSTDDGTLGLRGVVTDALHAWQRRRPAGATPALVLTCGPDAMLRAVGRATAQLGLACQLCLERYMGCGTGTCLSCVVRVRDASCVTGWRWAPACTEGPVFSRGELLDYDRADGS
jgi:dihydroorotate dehydrogenase electron transfer subunit